MRLPYLQVAMEVVELAAPDVAIQLGISLNEAIGMLVRVISWELARCPDDRPPSQSAAIEGPHVPRLIAAAAGFVGDPEVLVEALCAANPSLLERTPTGFRAKGLDRYDVAWKDPLSKSERARAAAKKRWNAKPDAKPMLAHASSIAPASVPHASGIAPACPPASRLHRSGNANAMPNDAQTQTQMQTHTQMHLKASPPREAVVLAQGPVATKAPSLEDDVAEVFERERKARYRGDPRDYEGLKRLEGEEREEILKRWTRALRHSGFPTVSTLAELCRFWDHFATDRPTGSGKDTRRAPVRAEEQQHGEEDIDAKL